MRTGFLLPVAFAVLSLACSTRVSSVKDITAEDDGGSGYGGSGYYYGSGGRTYAGGGAGGRSGNTASGSGGASQFDASVGGSVAGFDGSVGGSGDGGVMDAGPSGPTFELCEGGVGQLDDASPGKPCLMAGDLKVQMRFNGAVTNAISPWLKIVNKGSTSYPLNGLTLRYYYTIDGGSTDETFNCYYAAIGNGNVKHQFVPVSGVQLADHYLEISFAGGSAPAGGDTGDIQISFNKTDWQQYDASNDWSYDASALGGYVDAVKVTLYLNGTLIWGVEPPPAS